MQSKTKKAAKRSRTDDVADQKKAVKKTANKLSTAKQQPVATTTPPVAVSQAPVLEEAQKIWSEIKDVEMDMFGLPNQTVATYTEPVTFYGDVLMLKFHPSSVLPVMEERLRKKYIVELAEQYISVKRRPPPVVVKKK